MNTESISYRIVVALLRVALILSLIWAGWSIYRRLPEGGMAGTADADSASQTALLIVLVPAAEDTGALNIPVQLYPVDLAAARREFFDPDNRRSQRRAGVRFDDFLKQRMNGRAPIETQLNERGQKTIMVTSGKWWIHATLTGTHNTEWRLPVNIYGRKQTVELTSGNAYARTKSF